MALFLVIGTLCLGQGELGHRSTGGFKGVLGGPSGKETVEQAPDHAGQATLVAPALLLDTPHNKGSALGAASRPGYLAASFEGSRLSAATILANGAGSGRLTVTAVVSSAAAREYFIQPALGWNWGTLHAHNAVDIANACGTTVRAAAEAIVLESKTDGWNGGYGGYVLLEHPNGIRTRYAHLQAVKVEIGNYLKQGQILGEMGESGETTGCHLHFEVEGAKNPFVK